MTPIRRIALLSTPFHKYGNVCCERNAPGFQARRRLDAQYRREGATPNPGALRSQQTLPYLWKGVLTFILALRTFQGGAESNLQDYLGQIGDYQFVKQAEMQPQEAPLTPLSQAVWEDCGLVSASVWSIRSSQEGPFELTAYHLRHSAGAFSAYTLWKETAGTPSSQLAQLRVETFLQGRELLFWKGHLLLLLTGPTASMNTREGLLPLARRLVDAIPLASVHPLTVVHLPRSQLMRQSVTFYLGGASLSTNPHFPAPLDPHVGFDDQAEVAFAHYAEKGYPLFLLGYPTPTLAADYFARLQHQMEDFQSPEGVYMKRSGVLVSLFVGPEEAAFRVLEEVQYAPTVKWMHEKEMDLEALQRERDQVLTYLDLLRQSVLGTASFILLALGAGALTGLLRYGFVNRYKPRRRRQDGMIRLEISDR